MTHLYNKGHADKREQFIWQEVSSLNITARCPLLKILHVHVLWILAVIILYPVTEPRREPGVAERVGGDNGLRRHDRHSVQQGAVRGEQVGRN